MALYDWNHNGKNDIADDFIEYQIIHDKDNKRNQSYTYKKGISTIGAIVATVGGLFLGCGVNALLFGENGPVFLSVILWIVFSALLGAWFDEIGF